MPSPRRQAGIAGLVYVLAAAVESTAIADLPAPGSPAAGIRAFYADEALVAVTTAAGAISLAAYVLFALALARLAGGSRILVAGAVLGAGIAATGLGASAAIALGAEDVRGLLELSVDARLASGPAVALFLASVGRTRALPPALGLAACALAVPLALAPIAVIAGGLRTAATLAFAGQALWVLCASLWLLLGHARRFDLVRRSAFLLLVAAAGLVGVALLAAPGATPTFFAWGLAPEPLAAFAGGVYVAAAAVYGAALPRPWEEVRGLVAGAAVLSSSVLVATLAHLDVLDLGRVQAWAWLVLFTGFAAVTAALLSVGPRPASAGDLPRRQRVLLGAVAAVLAPVAIALWADPTGVPAPVELPPLGGRFAGSWVAFLAVLSAWSAWHGRAAEARLAGLALVALPLGALVAALRTSGGLDDGWPPYVAGLALLVAAGAAAQPLTRGATRGRAVALAPR